MEVESLPQIYENIWQEVKREPSEILSVDLASLSRAYLAHLEALVPGNLEKAGEYLRLTSYLVYLKVSSFYPKRSPLPKKIGKRLILQRDLPRYPGSERYLKVWRFGDTRFLGPRGYLPLIRISREI